MNEMNRARMRTGIGTARAGYTLIELLVVIVIGGILLSFAIPSFTNLTKGRNAQNAADALVWMSARARARAIERGQVHLLEIDPPTERAWIVRRNPAAAADTIETVDFANKYTAAVSTTANSRITICYHPRGYAFRCTANSPNGDVNVTITHIDRTAVARVKLLGQIERL